VAVSERRINVREVLVKYRSSVTFESSTRPPVTVRDTVVASSLQPAARLAAKNAMEKEPCTRWSSVVIVLEKIPDGSDAATVAGKEPLGAAESEIGMLQASYFPAQKSRAK
jgi:hypothetical protein